MSDRNNYQENKDPNVTNLEIIRNLVKYEIVSSDAINECVENGKLHMENVVIAS